MRPQKQIAQLFGLLLVLLFTNSALAFYDPHVGRFLSRDPIGYSDGPNEYQYVRSNPINRVDPSGLKATRYSCNCGWVNLGHANPANAKRLIAAVKSKSGAQSLLGGGFKIPFSMGMSKGPISASEGGNYYVRYELGGKELGVALGIFKEVSMLFETMQSDIPYGLVTSSGFSEGDLPSNLMGFYIAAGYTTAEELFGSSGKWEGGLCGVLSAEDSAKVLEKQGGQLGKSRNFDPKSRELPSGVCCKSSGNWPKVLTGIQEVSKGSLWRDWTIGPPQYNPNNPYDPGTSVTDEISYGH